MKLAFYYHIPFIISNGNYFVPGYLGIFIDGLANEVEELFWIAHSQKSNDLSEFDYEIKSKNVVCVDLGVKSPAWHREIFPRTVLKKAISKLQECDLLLVRSPTPLASHFRKVFPKDKIWFMIVGDYLEGIEHYKTSTFRNKLIYYYLHINDFFFQRAIKETKVVVNSPSLFEKYVKVHTNVFQIRTTTLTVNDFYWRENTCLNQVIQLLYTGSFSPAKGLFELVSGLNILLKSGIKFHLHLVGWEDDKSFPVHKALKARLNELGIAPYVTFHGKKKLGPELNSMYRMADIYILPSYHEGFPRTIWEAMANGLPVIATGVGGIPHYLENIKNAILIEPKDEMEISNAVLFLLNNPEVRGSIIKNAYELVKDNTIEIQTKNLIKILNTNR
jgi:glycosyltransferase involved in cell wall biosynthesis